MKALQILFGVGLLATLAAHAADERIDAFAQLARAGDDASAAAFVEFHALVGKYDSDLQLLRMLLLASVANSKAGDFGRARERLIEARRVFEWASPRSPLAGDAKVRRQAETALELVEHDLLSVLSSEPVDEGGE
jgi:hypothetical protein